MSAEAVAGLILLVLGGAIGLILSQVWRKANVLLKSGVSVVGTVVSVEQSGNFDGAGPAWVTTIEYRDTSGETHRIRWGGTPISTETVDIVYDPARPNRASLHTPSNPKAERFGSRFLLVLIVLSWSTALAGLLLLIGLLG